ncbi:MAG: hypothetical protein WC670_09680 [Pseudolabrys sp.]|jgi:hypothetical protein
MPIPRRLGRCLYVSVGCLLLSASAAVAASKVIGNWMVNIEADRFSDSTMNVVAITSGKSGGILAVRCLGGDLSIALGGPKFDTGDKFLIKFRTDKRPVVDTIAVAVSETFVEVDTTKEMVREMLTAKEYAVRIIGASSNDFIFNAGSGAPKALAEVAKACPLE